MVQRLNELWDLVVLVFAPAALVLGLLVLAIQVEKMNAALKKLAIREAAEGDDDE